MFHEKCLVKYADQECPYPAPPVCRNTPPKMAYVVEENSAGYAKQQDTMFIGVDCYSFVCGFNIKRESGPLFFGVASEQLLDVVKGWVEGFFFYGYAPVQAWSGGVHREAVLLSWGTSDAQLPNGDVFPFLFGFCDRAMPLFNEPFANLFPDHVQGFFRSVICTSPISLTHLQLRVCSILPYWSPHT